MADALSAATPAGALRLSEKISAAGDEVAVSVAVAVADAEPVGVRAGEAEAAALAAAAADGWPLAVGAASDAVAVGVGASGVVLGAMLMLATALVLGALEGVAASDVGGSCAPSGKKCALRATPAAFCPGEDVEKEKRITELVVEKVRFGA